VPHTYPMNFLLINNVWTATFFLTLMENVLRHWLDFQIYHGEIHELDKWNYEINARVH
jgi:hypothetical protein